MSKMEKLSLGEDEWRDWGGGLEGKGRDGGGG